MFRSPTHDRLAHGPTARYVEASAGLHGDGDAFGDRKTENERSEHDDKVARFTRYHSREIDEQDEDQSQSGETKS